MQAGIIALVLGALLRHVPAGAPHAWWPFALFTWGVLATVVPWLIAVTGGMVLDDDLAPRMAVALAIVYALPLWVASGWLAPTPYHLLGAGYRAMLGLYGVFLAAVVVRRLRTRGHPLS